MTVINGCRHWVVRESSMEVSGGDGRWVDGVDD